MNHYDEVIVWLTSTILRTAEFDIEAASLEAIAEDNPGQPLEFALAQASKSVHRGGAFGMEIAGAILVPVLVSAIKDFWSAYQKKMMEKLGSSAAEATIDQVRQWLIQASEEQQQADNAAILNAIRQTAAANSMAAVDLNALLAAIASGRVRKALAAICT